MTSERKRGAPASGFATLLATVMAVLPAAFAPAVAQTPTAEQMRIFQSLPADQRNAILQQMGISAGSSGTAPRAGQGGSIVVQQPAARPGSDQDPGAEPGSAGERRIRGGEQLLIELVLPESARATETETEITPDGRQIVRQQQSRAPATRNEARSAEETRRLVELRNRVLRRNPYELTRYGILQLPGLDPIPLAGLTQQEIQERLAQDPVLREFTVAVTVLRLEPQGVRALKPFGYEIFRNGATAFVPGTDIPAPPGYVLGAGDVMDVQLYGQNSQTYSIPIGRDGSISFPGLGPINVGGMTFGAAQSLLEGRVRQQMIGTQARVTLSELRSVRVLVLGDAEQPGSYVLSGLSTATNALFASGGVKPIGSLRRIEIRRDGQLLRRLDLYDVLLRGNTANDLRLQSGDAVFVPPAGPTVAIDGEVRRPAIYELLDDKGLSDLVDLAGGLTPEADGRTITVERIGEDGVRQAMTVDLTAGSGRDFALRKGDQIRIGRVRPVVSNGIEVRGHVHRPGVFAYREGMRITDVLRSADDLKPNADLHYVLIRRESGEARTISAASADLAAALRAPGTDADVRLSPRDVVTVFDATSPRTVVIDPLLDEIKAQSGPERLTSLVTINGRVDAPGRYPLEDGMRVTDLLRAGGGLQDAAYGAAAELTRYHVVQGERRRAELVQIDLDAARAGDPSADVELKPYDVLMIKELPEWGRVEQVELAGEVRFPGQYQIRRGETLSSLLERAGGLTPLAFPEGAVFTREELREREREQLESLTMRLQRDIAILSLQASQTNPMATTSMAAGQGLLDQLRGTAPVGRLVIDLGGLVATGAQSTSDLMLRDGDRLLVPRLAQEVSVLGEVQNPTSHLFRTGMTRDDVIALSGGATPRADRNRAYVVRADGSVVGSSSRWFGRGNVELRPGDTVVVPLDAEKMRPLPLWTAVTTIIYNLAVAAAAVGSL